MARASNKIGLCCIVKNESKVIERALKSALPIIDYALIVDTGSTDGTQKIISKFLEKHSKKTKNQGISGFFSWLDQYI